MIQFKGVVAPIKNFTDGSYRVSIDVSKEQLSNVVEIMKEQHSNVVVQIFPESEALQLVQQTVAQLRQTIYKKIMNAGCTEQRRSLYQVMFGKEHLKDFTLQELQEFDEWLGESNDYAPLRAKILEVIK